ncbi:MAG TPA: LEA type 2 family protein [Thermoanaerobaculia bacterium]|nr:LEA type 2 family protein [Thermoanaerobaculia bacterium]
MHRRLYLFLIPLLALTFGGCASTTRFIEPEVSLVDVRITDMTLFETTAVFWLRMHNPNPRSLEVDGGVYDFWINGVQVGRGMTTYPIEIPRYETGEAEVVVYLRNGALARRLGSILASGGVEYEIDARHFVRTGFGRREFDSVSRGRLSLGGHDEDRRGRRR